MTHTLTHRAPTVQLTLTVNINADRTLLLLIGLIWLAANQVRRLRHGLVVMLAEAVLLVGDVVEAVGFTVSVFGIAVSALVWGVAGVEM